MRDKQGPNPGLAQTWGDDTDAWVEYDLRGVNFTITSFVPEWKDPSGGCWVGLEVEAAGCKVARPPEEPPVCPMAVVLDTDDNAITLHRREQG
jgi:hypothetical protein